MYGVGGAVLRGAVVGTVFAALAVSAASASPVKLRTETAKTSIGTRAYAHVRAACPQGFTPTGGGDYLNGATTSALALDATTVSKDGWVSYAEDHSGSPDQLTTYARCVKGVKVKTVEGRHPLTPFPDAETATAKCPRHWSVVGGGGYVLSSGQVSTDVLTLTSRPAGGRSWKAEFMNYSSGGGAVVSVARCAKELAVKTAQKTVPMNDVGRTSSAKCPQGWSVSGGGAEVSGPSINPGNVSLLMTLPDDAQTWSAEMIDYNSPSDELTVFAQCLKT